MDNLTAIIIIAALCAIIPAGIVFLTVWSRIISQKADIEGAQRAAADVIRVDDRLNHAISDLTELKYRFQELDESLTRFNSKLAAREKAFQAAEKKAAKEQEPDQVAHPQPLPAQPQPLPQLPFPNQPTLIYKGQRFQLKQGG